MDIKEKDLIDDKQLQRICLFDASSLRSPALLKDFMEAIVPVDLQHAIDGTKTRKIGTFGQNI
jgi:hypothetical protein